jgi:hypothetical protein
MASKDNEVRGDVYSLLMDQKLSALIDPPLDAAEVYRFIIEYFQECIELDRDSNWAMTRYEVMWEVARLVNSMWERKEANIQALEILKGFLRKQILSGSKEIADSVITGTLEHIFTTKEIREYFSDWTQGELGKAYAETLMILGLEAP